MESTYKETLFGKDSKGNIKVWVIEASEGVVTMTHGRKGGKMASTSVKSSPKNVGRANETNAHQQAVIEATAKYVKQLKSGYFVTEEEALNFVDLTPMKAQNYKDHSSKLVFPLIDQPKLNGLRFLVDKDGNAWSKSGEPYVIPQHLEKDIKALVAEFGHGLDGEIYAGLQSRGGLSLQKIVSAFRKPNADTPKLQFWIYDTDHIETAIHRNNCLKNVKHWADQRGMTSDKIIFNMGDIAANQDQIDASFEKNVADGYEGSVYRNLNGMYEFGRRSYDMQKRKPRLTMEALVLSVAEDKIGQGVLTCSIPDVDITFECLMLKEADSEINLRSIAGATTLVEQYIEIEFEEFSDDGVPTKAVGVRVREVDPDTLEPKE